MSTQSRKNMKCGQIKRSDRPGKKVMKKVCKNGSERIIHAGDSSYGHNYSEAARKNFRARHRCETADPDTPRGLACKALWTKGGSKKSSPKGRKSK